MAIIKAVYYSMKKVLYLSVIIGISQSKMKPHYKLTASLMLLLSAYTSNAQTPVSLDSCRTLAIHNKKQIKVA